MIQIIAIIATMGLVLYYLYNKFKPHKKHLHTHKIDLEAQKLYDQKKHPKEESKTLTLEEKIELSWQFLTNVAEQILNKFSKEDQKQVNIIGKKLQNAGVKYLHNVNMEMTIKKSHAKNISKIQDQDIDKNQSQSR